MSAAWQAACSWSDFLIGHALSVFSGSEDMTMHHARRLLANLKRRPPEGGIITAREIHRRLATSAVPTKEDTIPAIEALTDHGWLRLDTTQKPGTCRPSERYMVHPLIVRGVA